MECIRPSCYLPDSFCVGALFDAIRPLPGCVATSRMATPPQQSMASRYLESWAFGYRLANTYRGFTVASSILYTKRRWVLSRAHPNQMAKASNTCASAFVWFVGFLLLFNLAKRWIGKWLGWLLLPIGTRSLTAYILHGLVIVVVSYFTVAGDNLLINTLLGMFAILGVWALLRIPFVEKVIPR